MSEIRALKFEEFVCSAPPEFLLELQLVFKYAAAELNRGESAGFYRSTIHFYMKVEAALEARRRAIERATI